MWDPCGAVTDGDGGAFLRQEVLPEDVYKRQALTALGVDVDRRRILMDAPIRTLGEHPVRVRLVENMDEQIPEETIIQKLQKYFSLDKEKITVYLNSFKTEQVSVNGESDEI